MPEDTMPDDRGYLRDRVALVRHAIADMHDEVSITASSVAERAKSLAGLDEGSLPTLRRIAAEQLQKMFDPLHTG